MPMRASSPRVESITRDLLALEFPDGERVVRAVHRGDELYPGPHAGWTSGAAVPDLIVELREDVQCVAGGFGRALSRRAPFPDHALDGILVIGGADVVQEDARGRLTLLDIAPMVHASTRRAGCMSGRTAGFLSRKEVRRIDDAEDEASSRRRRLRRPRARCDGRRRHEPQPGLGWR